MKRILIPVLLSLFASAARADFNDGVVQYLTGQYEQAYGTMRSLAETADHGYAQYYVGMMHMNGQGTEQSYEEAGKWFRKAAEHGIPQAQHKLADLYYKGQGLPRDFEQAFAWNKVAAAYQHQGATKALEEVRGQLSAEELAEAEKLSTKLVKDYGPKQALDQPIEVKPE